MTLYPLQTLIPSSYDCLDSVLATIKGGEVVRVTNTSLTSGDQAAQDEFDGYSFNVGTQMRPVVTNVLSSGARPLGLADDGTTGYGTYLGSVVGGAVGQQVVPGASQGPHTATGSGKLTVWFMDGFYSVSLDACDTTTATGLTVGNSTLRGGDPLYATAAGKLTPNISAAFESVVVAHFIRFATNGAKVSTQPYMVSTANSPSGQLVPGPRDFDRAEIFWHVES